MNNVESHILNQLAVLNKTIRCLHYLIVESYKDGKKDVAEQCKAEQKELIRKKENVIIELDYIKKKKLEKKKDKKLSKEKKQRELAESHFVYREKGPVNNPAANVVINNLSPKKERTVKSKCGLQLTLHSYLRYLQKIKYENISEADIKRIPLIVAKRYEAEYPREEIKREILEHRSQRIAYHNGADVFFTGNGRMQIRVKNNKIITIFPV